MYLHVTERTMKFVVMAGLALGTLALLPDLNTVAAVTSVDPTPLGMFCLGLVALGVARKRQARYGS